MKLKVLVYIKVVSELYLVISCSFGGILFGWHFSESMITSYHGNYNEFPFFNLYIDTTWCSSNGKYSEQHWFLSKYLQNYLWHLKLNSAEIGIFLTSQNLHKMLKYRFHFHQRTWLLNLRDTSTRRAWEKQFQGSLIVCLLALKYGFLFREQIVITKKLRKLFLTLTQQNISL